VKIERLVVHGLYGWLSFDMTFGPLVNIIIGQNGCGKTTALYLIAGLTGNDAATVLLVGQRMDRVEITVSENGRTVTGVFQQRFVAAEINNFKRQITHRASFVMMEDKEEERLVAAFGDPHANFTRLQDIMNGSLMRLDRYFIPGKSTGYFENGDGVKQLFRMFMRTGPVECPMLIESPERHLDIHHQRIWLDAFFLEDNQLIITTHSPSVLAYYKEEEYFVIDVKEKYLTR
jgi:predicted ATPase